MGHVGDIEHTYTLNKGGLAPQIMEDMRSAYKRAQEFLQTVQPSRSEADFNDAVKKGLFELMGVSPETIEKKGYAELPKEELSRLLLEKLGQMQEKKDGVNKQKIVSLDEIDGYLNTGWEFVKELSNNKVIVKRAE